MKKLLYLLFLGLCQLAAAQQAPPVQGSVRDSSGQPLAGATVQVTGTELQTTTGKDGRFTLATALEAPILRITHTGYRPREFATQGSREDLVVRDDVISLYREVVEPLNRDLAQFERLKKVALLPAEFSIASGELTPTLKLRRRVVLERWQSVVDGLYAEQ